tara:strand:- start:594 stop:818 length:225 start_codon:yes stop_codon:yes gene_type:complete
MNRQYITPTPVSEASNSRGSDVPVPFVIGLTNTGPNTTHQFIVVALTVVESAVSLTERVGFLARGDQIALRREA